MIIIIDIQDMMETDIHAITIKAKTPQQWEKILAKKQANKGK